MYPNSWTTAVRNFCITVLMPIIYLYIYACQKRKTWTRNRTPRPNMFGADGQWTWAKGSCKRQRNWVGFKQRTLRMRLHLIYLVWSLYNAWLLAVQIVEEGS